MYWLGFSFSIHMMSLVPSKSRAVSSRVQGSLEMDLLSSLSVEDILAKLAVNAFRVDDGAISTRRELRDMTGEGVEEACKGSMS